MDRTKKLNSIVGLLGRTKAVSFVAAYAKTETSDNLKMNGATTTNVRFRMCELFWGKSYNTS